MINVIFTRRNMLKSYLIDGKSLSSKFQPPIPGDSTESDFMFGGGGVDHLIVHDH